MGPLRADLALAAATPADLPSLSTLFARIFHANNAYHRSSIPDTPTTRAWWRESFARAMADPAGRVLIVRDNAAGGGDGEGGAAPVVAVLRARRFAAGEPGAGLMEEELTSDHDADMWRLAVEPLREIRPRLMGDAPHWMIELFGADSNYQGCGAGGALLSRCLEIADEEGLDTIVEANGGAASFYIGHGFEEKERFKVGTHDYWEHMLVHRCKKA